jgi:membrane-bound lytic murein transglycosylase C
MQGRWGKPKRGYLLNPENNINTGTAYLSLLQNKYLSEIQNPISKRYAVIMAYNGGVSSILRIFAKSDSQAFSIINSMSSEMVYNVLMNSHPSGESRQYLYKVSIAQSQLSNNENRSI